MRVHDCLMRCTRYVAGRENQYTINLAAVFRTGPGYLLNFAQIPAGDLWIVIGQTLRTLILCIGPDVVGPTGRLSQVSDRFSILTFAKPISTRNDVPQISGIVRN